MKSSSRACFLLSIEVPDSETNNHLDPEQKRIDRHLEWTKKSLAALERRSPKASP